MNTPNKITLIRIAIIPIFLFFILTDFVPYSRYVALVLFIIASATDGIDGHIARKYNQITNFGKFIDPLADKILVISALICMVQFGWISAVAVIIIISREFIVTGLRIIAMGSGKVIAAAMSGKLKTVVQIFTIVFTILAQDFIPKYEWLAIVVTCLVWISVAITIYSGFEYMFKNRELIDYKS